MKCKTGFIPQLFKSSVNYTRDRIISLSPIFFIAVFRMEVQPYKNMTYTYLFPLFDVVGKCPHRYE